MCLIWRMDYIGSFRWQVSLGKSWPSWGGVLKLEVSGGGPPLDSGPELELPPGTITALDMVGEGGRNMIQRSSSWSLHSILLLLEAHSSLFPQPHSTGKPLSAQETSLENSLSSCPLAPHGAIFFSPLAQSLIYLPTIKDLVNVYVSISSIKMYCLKSRDYVYLFLNSCPSAQS